MKETGISRDLHAYCHSFFLISMRYFLKLVNCLHFQLDSKLDAFLCCLSFKNQCDSDLKAIYVSVQVHQNFRTFVRPNCLHNPDLFVLGFVDKYFQAWDYISFKMNFQNCLSHTLKFRFTYWYHIDLLLKYWMFNKDLTWTSEFIRLYWCRQVYVNTGAQTMAS